MVDLAWYGDDFMRIVDKSTPEGLQRGGAVILEAARGRAPKRSGELAKSGFVVTEKVTTTSKVERTDVMCAS